jgi:hypothetical protein
MRCSFAHNYSGELQQHVLANWSAYGFPEL